MPVKRIASSASNVPKSASLESLPEELIVSCIARVSRLYYPTLSLVSKHFRSLLVSSEIYKTRSLLGRTESCLYIGLGFPGDPNVCWFTLFRKPDQTLASKKENISGNILVPVSFLNSPSDLWSYYLSHVGPCIYANCGPRGNPSHSGILDCRTHTWHDKPNGFTKEEAVGLDTDNFNRYCPHACTVENITYKYFREIMWSDNKGVNWRKLHGLEGLTKFACHTSVKLADFGGKMVVLWDEYVSQSRYKEKMIWCALIAFERRNNGKEILGKVEWSNAVLKVPRSYDFLFAIAATV